MAITQATSSVLAANAALNNLNAGASIVFTKPVSLSGNLTVDTNTLFVDSVNNRVGIGTTNPQQAIDFRPITFNASQSGGIRFDNTSGTWSCGIYIRSDGSGGPRLSLDAPYQTNTLNLYDNNVGIGTLTPTAKLDVAGSIKASGNLTVDTNTLFVDSVNDRVGIGTASSLIGKLDVAGSPTTTSSTDVLVLSRPFNPGVGFHTAASFKLSNPSSNVNNTRLDIALMQANAESPIAPDTTVMTLLGNGRVGIGTTTPSERLTVSGNISTTGNVTASNLVYTTDDQPIAGVKTFSNNIVGNGTANRLPNQLAVASSDIITKGLADSRYTSRNERITDDTTFVQTTWEQFLDFDDQYNQDLAIAAASGASTFGVSPAVFGDTFIPVNVSPSLSGNDLYTHRGVFLVRGPTGSNQAFYIGINRTTIPYFLTNRIDEFTSRIFITGADFATQGYFKIGPVQKGGTGGGDASLTGGLIFNPFLHPTNLVLGVNKSTAVTPFTFTTTAANVDFLDTGFNFTNLLNKWANITYKIDRTVNASFPTITIIITRDNVVLFQASYNIATHPVVSTWVRRTNLFVTGASNEIGLQSGHFTYTAPNRSQLFIDYLHYKVTGTSAAPSNWNSLRF
jgi:hypothetical protein